MKNSAWYAFIFSTDYWVYSSNKIWRCNLSYWFSSKYSGWIRYWMTWFHLKSPPDVCSNFYPIKNFGHFWCSKLKACIDKAKKEVVQVQSAKSDLDQLVNCTLNALDSFSWKSWTLMVFVLKNYFLLSLMFLLNFSIPFVQKQFHIGFHNGWKCRLGITIDVTYRMNSIQKRRRRRRRATVRLTILK